MFKQEEFFFLCVIGNLKRFLGSCLVVGVGVVLVMPMLVE